MAERRILVRCLVAAYCCAAWLPAFGQSGGAAGFVESAEGGAPSSFVLDADGLFRTAPKDLELIGDRLGEFYDRHRLPVYLAVYAGLIGTTVAERAEQLRQEWLGDGYGFVLVYDTDSGELALGRAIVSAAGGAMDDPAASMSRIPSYELTEVMLNVSGSLGEDRDRIAHLDKLTKELVVELDACLARLEEPGRQGPKLMFALAVIGMITLIALVALIGVGWIARAEENSGRVRRLPDVLVGHRLGAPCGGGRISSRSFRQTAGGA